MIRVMAVPAQRIDKAVEVLLGGGVVAFPTDTVYGLGALGSHEEAVARIFDMKGRPRTRALILHLHEASGAHEYVDDVPDYARELAKAFWPGALTLVFRKKPIVPDIVTGGGDTVGVRVPNQTDALRLIEALSEGLGKTATLAAPSANRFGEPPATTAQEVVVRLGAPGTENSPDMILDGGACRVKVPSTIISCVGAQPRLLRQGSTPIEAIEEVIGMWVDR